ncbi:MAG: hypothetical protein RL033_1651 [Pseudomonadota bacterium]
MALDPLEPVTGMLIITAVHVPFLREVVLQLRTASQLYEQLSPARRAAFPDAPTRPALVFLGSARFQLAFWAYVKREDPLDSALQAGFKRVLRRSMRRKVIVAVLAFLVACALVAAGWRPYPQELSRAAALTRGSSHPPAEHRIDGNRCVSGS